MPSSKPDLPFDSEGICGACRNFEHRKRIDWSERASEFKAITDQYRDPTNQRWDCIIPVSGGKDSTAQVLKILELGLRPLCVTSTTCDLSDLGRENIENLKGLGVDYIEFTANPRVRKKLNRIGLETVGDIAWPEHVGIFTVPVRAAVQFEVPLIVWGENAQHEYGGPAHSATEQTLTRRWLEEFGGLLGLRVADLPGQAGITPGDLASYQYPSDEELARVGVTGIFLGYFFEWDGLANTLIAEAYGFKSFQTAVEGGMLSYENLDNLQHGIHDYFKFLKYGFGRATDHACMQVRRGRLSRSQAIEIVRIRDGKFPWTYLGRPLAQILEPLEMGVEEFKSVCDRFTNRQLFLTDNNGELIRDNNENLTKINYDNVD